MSAVMPEFVDKVIGVNALELDGTKVGFYRERIEAWKRGERIAPITMDVAWTRKCAAACDFCYASLQASDGQEITREHAFHFLEDAAEIGVKGVSLISDGESTEVEYFADSVEYGSKLGIQIGTSSNGLRLTPRVLEQILPHLTYLRFNFSGGDQQRWAQIMGLKSKLYERVTDNIKAAMAIKRRDNLPVSINVQMVVMPKHGDQIIPLAKLCRDELRPDYLIYKHTANSEDHGLDVDYRDYSPLFPVFKEAESYADEGFRVQVKWSRLKDEGKRSYQRCYGPPFILQMSGNGLIAPCGPKFNDKHRKFHIGNICETRFRDIYQSDRYWEVLKYLASEQFDAQKSCGENCLQTNTNAWLDEHMKGNVAFSEGPMPAHAGFL